MAAEVGGDGGASILLNHVIPALGVLLFVTMCVSPTRTIWRTRQKRDIGEYNPLPNVVLVCNGATWFAYALVTRDPYITCSSSTALLVSVGQTVILAGQMKQRIRDRLTLLLLLYLAALLALGAASSLARLPPRTLRTLWAVAANTGSIFYYSSLPATLLKVLRQRSSASIHLGNSLMAAANCALWLVYFVFAKHQYIVPTTTYYLGLALALLNLALCRAFPRRPPPAGLEAPNGGQEAPLGGLEMASGAAAASTPSPPPSTLADAAELEQLSGFPAPKQRSPAAAAAVPLAEEEGECGGGMAGGEEVRLPETPPRGRTRRLPED